MVSGPLLRPLRERKRVAKTKTLREPRVNSGFRHARDRVLSGLRQPKNRRCSRVGGCDQVAKSIPGSPGGINRSG
jgi:hypothetical protein